MNLLDDSLYDLLADFTLIIQLALDVMSVLQIFILDTVSLLLKLTETLAEVLVLVVKFSLLVYNNCVVLGFYFLDLTLMKLLVKSYYLVISAPHYMLLLRHILLKRLILLLERYHLSLKLLLFFSNFFFKFN